MAAAATVAEAISDHAPTDARFPGLEWQRPWDSSSRWAGRWITVDQNRWASGMIIASDEEQIGFGAWCTRAAIVMPLRRSWAGGRWLGRQTT